ncbi:FixH family protein [Aromatoleum sp.]|uniref:FixH family protein n=1 Tax=Aromatoleum sp. TaxID=2307007 RepID=UPI002FC9DAF9
MAGDDSGVTRRQAAESNGARIVALAIAGAFLLLILAFVAMAFIDHDEARLNPVGPVARGAGTERGGVVFSGAAGTWEVRGQVAIDAQRRAHVAFDLVSPTGQPAPASLVPTVAFDRPGRETTPLTATVSREAPGSYAAASPLPAEGQWRLRIGLPEIAAVLLFDATE